MSPRQDGEPAAFARNGQDDDSGPERTPGEERLQPLDEEPLDEPAGFGEQPSLGRGEENREDRQGRGRRRRGRRGGRRGGRDRDAPRQPDDRMADDGHQGGPNGAVQHEDVHSEPVEHARADEPPVQTEAPTREHREPVESAPLARLYQAPEPPPPPPRPSWTESRRADDDAPSRGSSAAVADTPPPPMPPPEPEPEDPSRPARKGWWQRKFSGG